VYGLFIRDSLLEAGFTDMPANGGYVLGLIEPEGVALGDVIAGIGFSKQRASQLVDTLVVRGYVERTVDPDDRRRVLLTLTERGQAASESVFHTCEDVDARLVARVGPEKMEHTKETLAALADLWVVPSVKRRLSRGGRPMSETSRASQFAPIFPVSDLLAALAHYETLGFEVRSYEGGADYGFAERDDVSLHLTTSANIYPPGTRSAAYLTVEDADLLARQWSEPDVAGVTTPPEDMPWGMHEGTHRDPDGNLIRFGSSRTRRPRLP
jgi:DNA-binding MarR family transcriptional regulator/catechol 2,3-dioxygenase-like lactoylglutathione lyase family enzyme